MPIVNRPDGPDAPADGAPGIQKEQPMFGTIGSIAGSALGGPVGGMVGGAIGDAIGGSGNGGQQAQAFDKALSQFAMQIAGDGMDEMNQAMSDTEEEFE
ncbi:hypothetical protein CTI14_11040 [Methylobacterium radiotolerans]|nr:hypothetical protein CTI14_11040 [Methylobacterium radiotolerans]